MARVRKRNVPRVHACVYDENAIAVIPTVFAYFRRSVLANTVQCSLFIDNIYKRTPSVRFSYAVHNVSYVLLSITVVVAFNRSSLVRPNSGTFVFNESERTARIRTFSQRSFRETLVLSTLSSATDRHIVLLLWGTPERCDHAFIIIKYSKSNYFIRRVVNNGRSYAKFKTNLRITKKKKTCSLLT